MASTSQKVITPQDSLSSFGSAYSLGSGDTPDSQTGSGMISRSNSMASASSGHSDAVSTATKAISSASGFSQSTGDRLNKMQLHRSYFQWSAIRRCSFDAIETRIFRSSILFVIFLNTILIALQTERSLSIEAGWYFEFVDNIFLAIYLFEMFLKMFALRRDYFKTGWNLFDMVIVFLSFTDWIRFIVVGFSAIDPKIFRFLRVFRAVRAFRALRVLRTVSFLKSLQVIVNTLLKSIPALSSIVFLIFLVMYIFSIIGLTLFGEISPFYFGSMGRGLFTLFQLITLDDWSEIYTEAKDSDLAGSMLAFLLIFIILETFVFINLFIAVIVNNLQASSKAVEKKGKSMRYRSRRRLRARNPQSRRELSTRDKNQTPSQPWEPDADEDLELFTQGSAAIRDQQLSSYYFMLLAALENNTDFFESQQRVVDDLVDLVKPKGEQTIEEVFHEMEHQLQQETADR